MMTDVISPLLPAVDFNFDSASTTPYLSAASSPPRIANFYYSAPTSPVSATLSATAASLSSIPFSWEEKPGIAKSTISTAASSNYGDADDEIEPLDTDFAFDFSGQLESNSLPADQLFDGGKIKPLKPPPGFLHDPYRPSPLESPKSPRLKQAFNRKRDFDPFTAALEKTRQRDDGRGRERTRNKQSRSVSPFRVSDLLFDPEPSRNPNSTANTSSFSFSSIWYKKWKIKDLLLFRSASEGRASDKQRNNRQDDVVKSSSCRSTDTVGSGSSRRRSGPPISAHELHYTVNRAVSEEMKKRTSLPYKQGLLGCLGFHPTVTEISKNYHTKWFYVSKVKKSN